MAEMLFDGEKSYRERMEHDTESHNNCTKVIKQVVRGCKVRERKVSMAKIN